MFRISACFSLIIFFSAGCTKLTPTVETNAKLKKNSLYALMDEPQPPNKPLTLIARCSSVNKYKTTVKGNWKTYWYFTKWQVIEVNEGQWKDPKLSFIYTDTWPTAESGIRLKKPILPLYLRCLEGCVTRFVLDISQQPPLIVDMKRRSLIPPHEPLKAPEWDIPESTEDIKLRVKIIKAAKEYLNLESFEGLYVTEERNDFYVVEHVFDSAIEAVTIDKKSFEAERVKIPTPM